MRSEDNRGIKASIDSEDFILKFDSDSDEFARGFACGEIWACLTDNVEEVHCLTTIDNSEMIMRMASAANYSFVARDLESNELDAVGTDLNSDEWLVVVMRANNGV